MAHNPHHQAQAREEAENQFDERTLSIDRVARVVKGGRRFRFRALVVVGDKQGSLGIGTSKGSDVTAAITKASDIAKKNMVKIPMSGTTIPHESFGKVGGAHILIKPAKEGTGLIAGSVTRDMLEAAGISNIVSKSLGNKNKINAAYSVMEAVGKLVAKEDWVTNTGKKSKKAEPVAKEAK